MCFGDENLQLRSDGNAANRTSAGCYDSLYMSEVFRQEGSEAINRHPHEYNFLISLFLAIHWRTALNSMLHSFKNRRTLRCSLSPLSSIIQAIPFFSKVIHRLQQINLQDIIPTHPSSQLNQCPQSTTLQVLQMALAFCCQRYVSL